MNHTEATPGSRPSRWHRPMWWTNLLFMLPMLLAYLSLYVSPVTLWQLAFFGIVYPYLLILHLFFIVYWLVFRTKRILPSLIVLLIGWNHMGQYVQVFGHATAPAAKGHTAFKVMSWNVRLFDLYNWSGNVRTRDEIFDLLRAEDAGILCLQEYYSDEGKTPFMTTDTLLKDFRWNAAHTEYTQHTKHGQQFGIATISAYPIVAKGALQFPDDLNNLCIWSDIVVGTDTIRVYNAHLASIRFGDQDYRFMKDLDSGMDGDSLTSGGKRIMARLKNAFIRRAKEADRIAEHIRKSPHPVVYCGDMNDTPVSYSYHTLCKEMTDAFVESGSGIGHTYIGAFPSFRIDHILHSHAFRSWDFRTLPDELSDHRPITAWMMVE